MAIDLFLDGVAPRHRSAALFEQIRQAVVGGRLGGGDRLPTSRELAADLGIARSTVATVYARLVAEGYAVGRVGDGTFVANLAPARVAPAMATMPVARPPRWAEPPLIAPPGGWRIDLRTGRPDPALFPLTDWRRSVTAVLHEPPPGYGQRGGHPALRQAIAAWVARSRGVAATVDQVLVTAGSQGAFDLCARVLLGERATVAVEDPGYVPARQAFAEQGLRLVGIPVDDEGMVVERIPRRTAAVLVTPSHQSPSGVLMSTARRRRLLDLAAATGAIVFEDDYDTEYRYVDRPLEPLARLDPGGRVVYVGSFSKTISPSLRIGFVVAAPGVIAALAEARQVVDGQPPHLTQAALAGFLSSGGFERHLRRTRRIYRRRRDHLGDLLDGLVQGGVIASYGPTHAGLHVPVRLVDGSDAAAVAAGMVDRGIAITTTADNRIAAGPIDLLIGFGLAGETELSEACAALADVVSRGRRGRRRRGRETS